MSALPGYPTKIYAKASASTPGGGDEIAGVNDATWDEMIDLLDSTTFKGASASAVRTRLGGLRDGSLDLSGDLEAADAPQILLRTSMRTRASVWISIYFNPSAGSMVYKGVQVECLVEKFTTKTSAGGKAEFSCSLKPTAAPADVTG